MAGLYCLEIIGLGSEADTCRAVGFVADSGPKRAGKAMRHTKSFSEDCNNFEKCNCENHGSGVY